MISGRAVGIGVLSLLVFASAMEAQTAAHSRDFQLGGALGSVSDARVERKGASCQQGDVQTVRVRGRARERHGK